MNYELSFSLQTWMKVSQSLSAFSLMVSLCSRGRGTQIWIGWGCAGGSSKPIPMSWVIFLKIGTHIQGFCHKKTHIFQFFLGILYS